MTVEERLKRWAAARLDLRPEQIESVEFVREEGFAYSEQTEEPPSHDAIVHHDPIAYYSGTTTCQRIDVMDLDFGDLLREILETE